MADAAKALRMWNFGTWSVDRHNKEILGPDGRKEGLKPKEFQVLDFLIRNANDFFTAEELVAKLWDEYVDKNGAEQIVSHIRSKLQNLGLNPGKIIYGEKGKGYRFLLRPDAFESFDPQGVLASPVARPQERLPMGNRIEGAVPLSIHLWHLPEPRNPLFKGRERELEDLHRESGDKARRRVVQVLAALCGLGASSLAVEYAYRFRDEYDLVWWFDARSPAEVKKQYDVLAKNFDRSYAKRGLDAIDYVSNRLAKLSNWLIIFDNVVSAEDIAGLLPRTGVGHIIVTATDRNWGGNATIYDVQPLDHAEAVSFLNARLNGLPSNSDRELIPELATELQGMPLALEVASAYMEITHCTISAYLDRMRALRAKSERVFVWDRSVEVAVAETWRLTLARAQCESPGVFILVSVISWLDDCEIPLSFIRELDSGEHVFWGKLRRRIIFALVTRFMGRKVTNPKPPFPSLRRSRYVHTFTEALGRLRQYSLATQSESGFMIPPLAKLVGRRRIFRFTKLNILRLTLVLSAICADESIRHTEMRSVALWGRHILRALEHAEELEMSETDEAFIIGVQTLESIEQKLADPTCTP